MVQLIPAIANFVDACQHLVSSEEIEGFSCESCGERTTVLKKTTTHGFSNVILLQYQRWNAAGRKTVVRTKAPEFIAAGAFDLTPMGSRMLATHRLIGIINHEGAGMKRGHYTAHIFDGERWCFRNDEEVREVPDPRTDDAFLLVYERLD